MADNLPLAMANPALLAPRIASPTRSSTISSSPSRSSSRQHYTQARDFDPILRSLSPTATLRAFSEIDHLSPGDSLGVSLQSTTTAQRNLGAKAAQACLDVRSWALELEAWEWPGTFEVPLPARKKQRMSVIDDGKKAQDKSSSEQSGEEMDYWGSLPSTTVKEYEQRADEISQQLDDIDVEELKGVVLSAHHQAGTGAASIDDSIGAIGAATDLRRLDDFTAIITATILQALPYLSRLHRLLDTWTIRLVILRQAPRFLKALWQAQADLDNGWAAVSVAQTSNDESSPQTAFTRGNMIEMQSMIEPKVSSLGRKIDRFLDDLEGRPETVPDSWVDEMEALEQKYAEWIVRAERKVMDNELKKKNRESRMKLASAVRANTNGYSALIEPEHGVANVESSRNGNYSTPSLRHSPIGKNGADTPPYESQTISHASLREPTLPTAYPSSEIARVDSSTIPSGQGDTIVDLNSINPEAFARDSARGARHIPIMLPYDGGDGQGYPTDGITSEAVSRRGSSVYDTQPNSLAPSREPSLSFAKKRAMFAGDLERTQSLQKTTKSPVRPFEHASNAFARLFKTESSSASSTPDRSRSSSLRSEIRRRSGSGKNENGIMWGGRAPASPIGSMRRKTVGSSTNDAVNVSDDNANNTPVVAHADAPPVPVLPPKSPRRSMQSPFKSRPLEPVPSSPTVEKPHTEAFPGFEFGENWPLSPTDSIKESNSHIVSQIAELPGRGIRRRSGMDSPRKPLESEAFDRMFVDSLPGTPDERAESPANEMKEPAALPEPPENQSPVHYTGVPTVSPSMVERSPQSVYHSQFAGHDNSASSPASVRRPNHIDMPTKSSLPVPRSNTDDPLTPNSVASDTYSPEIQDARVSYFQIASPPLSRRTSASIPSPQLARPKSSQTSSPMQLRDAPKEDDEVGDDPFGGPPTLDEGFHFPRASKISLESQPRLEVKSIDLPRRKSSSSSAIDPEQYQQQQPQQQQPFDDDSPISPARQKSSPVFPTPPAIREERPRSPVSPLPSSSDQGWLKHKTSNLSAVSDQATPVTEKGNLNAFMSKRRGLGIQPNGSATHLRSSRKVETDSFDRHVNEVLQQLPAPIRFRSGATTPQPRPAEPRNFSGPRPKNTPRMPSRTASGPGGLTLAPADPTPSRKSASANEPEVKLYHLTQAGREDPIKLFVRLVGEGERVMVRVGGGWADLADYLRQYAEHHGSRTVSGEVDVKEVVTSPAIGTSSGSGIHPALRRQASGPLSALNGTTARSNSPLPTPPTPHHQPPRTRKRNRNP
ncbi:hypothetical protein Q7P37_004602 [Cladosporium fusiforme]